MKPRYTPLSSRRHAPRLARQRGMVLILSIIVLIAMTLASYAMMRAVGGGTAVAGNLAFRQAAIMAADSGVETGIANILSTTDPSVLTVRDETTRPYYYPFWSADAGGTAFDPFTFNWTAANAASTATNLGSSGDTSTVFRYVVHRMCMNAGAQDAAGQQCVIVPTNDAISAAGCKADEDPTCGKANQVYYRVTVRVEGARNTISYVQVIFF